MGNTSRFVYINIKVKQASNAFCCNMSVTAMLLDIRNF